MAPVTVRLPDGSTKEFEPGTTALEFAQSIGPRLAKAAVAATFDGQPVDLSRSLPDGAEVTVVTAATPLGREVLRHSTAHVLAQAVLRLWPGAHFAIGPVIEDGFYYDFELPGGAHFTDEDLERIASEMRAIMAEDQPFVRHEHSIAEGLELFGDQPFKREIIEAVGAGQDEVDAASEGAGEHGVSTYWNSPAFTDLCRGPHVPGTGKLGHFALMRVAGAYWRGDEKRQQLQRIYGTAWESEDALAEHLHRLEEAEKRDHRKLGVELDLFSFPHELGRRTRRLAPEGRHRPQAHGGLQPPAAPGRWVRVRLHAAPGQRQPLRDLRAPRLLQGRDVPAHGDGQRDVLPQADELPDALPHLRQPSAQLPRAAVAAVRARHRLPLRAGRDAARADADPRLHPGRQPHLLHRGAAGRRDRLAARLRHECAAGLRLHRVHGQPVDQGPRQVRGLRRDLGEGHRCPAPGARTARTGVRGQGG